MATVEHGEGFGNVGDGFTRIDGLENENNGLS